MSSTGFVESWNVNPIDVGPIYPFVGWETLMFAACVAFCIGFIVWKISTETANYAAKAQQLRDPNELAKASAANPLGNPLAENDKHVE